jgi:nitroreductase
MNKSADQMFEMINARNSDGLLSEPAPSHEEILQAIQAALTAPDHHRLQPWRFLTVSGDARIKLGNAFQQALIAQGETDGDLLRKVQSQPLRAPLILVCIVDVKVHPKVPEVEQVLSTGAAVQNILLMLKAQGYGAIWRTGAITGSSVLKQLLGLREQDIIAGFIYIGSLTREIPIRALINQEPFIQSWN